MIFRESYKIGDIIHYLRIIPYSGINEIIESRLRTVEQDYMVASDSKTKQAIYISTSAKDLVFRDRKLATKESKKYHVRKVTTITTCEEEE